MGKFPRSYGPTGRQPEEFEMTSEMLEKLTNNMKWKLWPTADDGKTSSPANTSAHSNKENDVAVCPDDEAEITVNNVSSLLSNLKLKAGICAMADVVDATPEVDSLVLEPSLKGQDHHIQKIKENRQKKYSREFLLLIRKEMEKQQKPFTGKIECPVVIRGNNDERNNTVTIPRRGQSSRQQQQQQQQQKYYAGENGPNFNNGVPAALQDHYYSSSMNGYEHGNGNRSGFYYNHHLTNNNHRYFGGSRQRRNSSESSTGSNKNYNQNPRLEWDHSQNSKIKSIPSLLSTPIVPPPSISSKNSSANRVLRDSTQNKLASNSTANRGRFVMEPLVLKKQNTGEDNIAEILRKNQVKSILPLKVIKK